MNRTLIIQYRFIQRVRPDGIKPDASHRKNVTALKRLKKDECAQIMGLLPPK